MSKRKVSVENKIYAVNLYLDGKESQRRIADMFDVSLDVYKRQLICCCLINRKTDRAIIVTTAFLFFQM